MRSLLWLACSSVGWPFVARFSDRIHFHVYQARAGNYFSGYLPIYLICRIEKKLSLIKMNRRWRQPIRLIVSAKLVLCEEQVLLNLSIESPNHRANCDASSKY